MLAGWLAGCAGWLRWLAGLLCWLAAFGCTPNKLSVKLFFGCGCTTKKFSIKLLFEFYSTIPRECWNRIRLQMSRFYPTIPWELLNRIAAGSKYGLLVQPHRASLWLASNSIQQFPGNSWIESKTFEGDSISLKTAPIQRWTFYRFAFVVGVWPYIPPSL